MDRTSVHAPHEADPVSPPLPVELQLEVTGACNLRCRMCLVRYRDPIDRVNGSFPLSRFVELLDANPQVERITLQGLGEPLLAPGLSDMIALATARGIDVGFNTNATLLTRDRAERLVDAGLAWLHVSLDGATAETYERIRDGAHFEKVCAHIAGLTDVMRRKGASRPSIQLVFVAMRGNVAELPDVVRLAGTWGVPRVWVQNLSHSFADGDPAGTYADIRAFTEAEALWSSAAGTDDEAHFDRARAVAEAVGVDLRLPRVESPVRLSPRRGAGGRTAPGCDWPWRSAYVTHEGIVQPCCMIMGSERATMGDLRESTFDQVWHGATLKSFRAALLTDEPPPVCRGCSQYRRTF